jgi:hypothetical protein
MATKQQDQHAGEEKQERQELNAVIGRRVLHGLGEPGDFLRVQVRRLWDDHYRVNVLVGLDAASAKVAHSYFLVADGEGNISAATPEIMRRY